MKTILKFAFSFVAVIAALASCFGQDFIHLGIAVSTASIITPGDITFNPNEVRSFAEGISETAFENPDFGSIHNVVENIVAGDQIAYFGRLSKVTKADAGCGTGAAGVNIPTSEKFWEPAKTKIWISECTDDLDATFLVYLKKKGVDYSDWTQTELMGFLMDRVTSAAAEDLWRIVWFNDKDIASVDDSPAGILTSGVSLTDYNIIDAFWTQIYAIVAAAPTQGLTITKNSGVTKVLQEFDAQDTIDRKVTGYFRDLVQKADYRLRGRADAVILCTQSMADQYENELESLGIDASFQYVQPGISKLTRKGVTIIAINFWDRTIRADFDNGTTYYQPHRAVFTTQQNLMVGVDAKSSLSASRVYYDETTEKGNIKFKYKVDAKIREDFMLQAAY